MADINTKQTLICDYFADWINLYKKGAVRNVTFDKYQNTLGWLTTHSCIAFALRWCVYCKRGEEIRAQ